MSPRIFRALSCAVAASCASLLVSSSQADQLLLQHMNHIPLNTLFNAGDGMGGLPSPYGQNPLSVAFDGTHAYIGGWNNTFPDQNTVGVVRVDDLMTLSPSLVGLAGSQFLADGFRGIVSMVAHDGAVYTAYDATSVLDSHVTRYDTNGNQIWRTPNPGEGPNANGSGKPFAIGIDPVAGPGGTAQLALIGEAQGRRASLRLSDGTLDYTYSGGVNPGGILTGVPNNYGFSWRGVAFDADGNIALSSDNGYHYGTRTGQNQWTALDATPDRTTGAVDKVPNATGVGQDIEILEGFGTSSSNLLIFSGRRNEMGNHELQLVDAAGNSTIVDARHAHIRNVNGSTTDLSQIALVGDEDGVGIPFTNELKTFAFGRDANNLPLLMVVSFIERTLDVYGLEPTWNVSGGGMWSNSANWVMGAIPDSPLTNARFGGAITGPANVVVDSPRTVKVLKFDSPHSYTLSGAGNITLNSPGTPMINVLQGDHSISVPVNLAKNTQINVAAGNTLSVQRFSGQGLELRSGTTRIVPNGTVTGTSNVTSLTIEGGRAAPQATLDITNNAFVVDYDPAEPSPFDEIEGLIRHAYNNGAWNLPGITSSQADASSFGVGYAEASDLSSVPAIFGSVDATAVLLRRTRYGDATLDGIVDLSDFNRLAANFGSTVASWFDGDFNYDGNVDLQDFNRLAGNFGLSASGPEVTPDDWSALASAVPEPAMLSLLALVPALTIRRRRST